MLLRFSEDITEFDIIKKQGKKELEDDSAQLDRLEEEREGDGVGRHPYKYRMGDICLCGYLDPDNVTLEVHDLEGNLHPKRILRLFKHVISSLEINHPEIDIILWEIDKNRRIELIQDVLKVGFEVYEPRPYTLLLAYHMNNNSPSRKLLSQKTDYDSKGADNSGSKSDDEQ